MGTYKKGINGRFTEKVGNTVGSQWKGISVMKSLPDFVITKPVKNNWQTGQNSGLLPSFYIYCFR